MTLEQFKHAVNEVGYAVIASPTSRASGTPAEVPPFDDFSTTEQPFRWDREATYDELCIYTAAAYGEHGVPSQEEWAAVMNAEYPGWIPYIIRTD